MPRRLLSRKNHRGSPTRAWVALLLFALLYTACDRGVSVYGPVTSSHGPIRPAEIRVECPELCAFAVVQDDRGGYSAFKWGGCPLTCRLRYGVLDTKSSCRRWDDFV